MFLRENAGVITTADHSALDGPGIARFAKRVFDEYSLDQNTIYVVIDPNGGGSSAFAMVSFATYAGKTVVIGADAKQITGDQEMESFLTEHVNLIRIHHPLARLILIIERNYGGSVLSTRIANILGKFIPIRNLTADPQSKQRVGTVTTNEVKDRGRVDLQRMLRLDLIGYAFNFVSQEKSVATIKDKITKQMLDFKFYKEELKTDSKKTPNSILSGATQCP